MTDRQLQAYGELIAEMERVLNGRLQSWIVDLMLRNPKIHAFPYWFFEAMRTANDAEGLKMAELRQEVGQELCPVPPAKQSVIQTAYHKYNNT